MNFGKQLKEGLITQNPVLDQFIGMSGAGSLVVGKNITAVSGATVSTKGINMGANAALAVAELLG